MAKSNNKIWWVVGIIAIFGIAGILVYQNLALQSELAGFNNTSTTSSTLARFNAVDAKTKSANDWTEDVLHHVYRMSTEDLDDDEIADREKDIAYYELDEIVDDGDTYDLVAGYRYWVISNGTGFVQNSFIPVYGTNTVTMMNETVGVNMIAMSDILGYTINQTNSREWSILLQTIDADGEPTNKEGYIANYDFYNNINNYTTLRVEFNTTALESWCVCENPENTIEVANGNYIYYELPITLLGDEEINIKLSSLLGSSFEVIGMAIGYGNSDNFTSWDSQN